MTPPKILFIGGTHPRHLYYANQIHIRYPLAGAVLQDKGMLMPAEPKELNYPYPKKHLWNHHFHKRAEAEHNYFGHLNGAPNTPETVFISSLGSGYGRITRLVKKINPDIALVFGCGMIRGELAEALPKLTINLHLGLSPRYRGAATLFWPFYFLEPQWAGCTFHKIVDEPDAGDILHQCVPELARGDKIHDVAVKAVVKATEDMIKLLGHYRIQNIPKGKAKNMTEYIGQQLLTPWKYYPQSTTGKNFLSRDFQPSHLRMIYETYNDDIVDQYLDGNLKQHKPKLVRQF